MHEIVFYCDQNGNEPVYAYIKELEKNSSKDNRIKLHKIQDYINMLSTYGTSAGEPYVKHLDGAIWELRPLRDRVLFAGCMNGNYVLLHQFMKKTQKTPMREIEKAKRELMDFIERSSQDE